jgi:multidrug efflux pump subunit AcrA (membrane-fusion protein)
MEEAQERFDRARQEAEAEARDTIEKAEAQASARTRERQQNAEQAQGRAREAIQEANKALARARDLAGEAAKAAEDVAAQASREADRLAKQAQDRAATAERQVTQANKASQTADKATDVEEVVVTATGTVTEQATIPFTFTSSVQRSRAQLFIDAARPTLAFVLQACALTVKQQVTRINLATTPWTVSFPPINVPVADSYAEYIKTHPGARAPGYAEGTGGFVNFGKGTPVVLHGWEAVVPRDEAASGAFATVNGPVAAAWRPLSPGKSQAYSRQRVVQVNAVHCRGYRSSKGVQVERGEDVGFRAVLGPRV